MANRKFYIEYYLDNRLERKTIRNWANENRNLFPNYTFEDRRSNFPITHEISRLLQNSFGFQEIEQTLEVVLRHPNPNFSF